MPTNPKDAPKELIDLAFKVQKKSYSPYSKFKVGAAILADDGQTYGGCNVENVSYPLGQCAEASAISAMISNGATKIQQVLIASPNKDYCPPCGGCRQKIREFADADTMVHLMTSDGKSKSMTLGELLPMAFS